MRPGIRLTDLVVQMSSRAVAGAGTLLRLAMRPYREDPKTKGGDSESIHIRQRWGKAGNTTGLPSHKATGGARRTGNKLP